MFRSTKGYNMKVNLFTTQHNANSRVAFKKGLTSYEVNSVKNMYDTEYRAITQKVKNLYGINADVGESNTVAFCLDAACNIMNRAGFKLPQNFEFAPCELGTLGQYYPALDKVVVNSRYNEFNDLERQNSLEESHGSHHPDTKHFLSTYLHEFSHAAHFKNLCDKMGFTEAFSVFMGFLSNNSPGNLIVAPFNSMLKTQFPKLASKIIDDLFPPENGLYSKTDLDEYIAEKNSKKIAEALGDNFNVYNISTDLSDNYVEHPYDWDYNSLKKQLENLRRFRNATPFLNFLAPGSGFINKMIYNTKIEEIIDEDIKYTDGDIWNGNIDNLQRKSISVYDNDY